MDMDTIVTAVIAAIVSALVSVMVGLLNYRATVQKLTNEKQMHEREMRRRMTEKLYDLRLEAYPKAFEITDQLRKDYIFAAGLDQEYLKQVSQELNEWYRSKAGFIISAKSIKAWYEIRNALNAKPKENGNFSESQRKKIWQAKNHFRGALRNDVNILYLEEEATEE